MKHHGARMVYAEERIKDLVACYQDYLRKCERIYIPDMYEGIVNSPARRFYVSGGRAAKVIYAMMQGKPLTRFRKVKREMFEEIYRRVLAMKREHPDWSVSRCCDEVVEQPAPKFYLSAGSANVMISQHKKRCYEERKKRLRHLW